VADARIGVDLQAEALRRVQQRRAGLARRENGCHSLRCPASRCRAPQVVGQREVLVHHADARGQRRARLARRQRLAVDLMRAGVGPNR
jgi:hypothetical protein